MENKNDKQGVRPSITNYDWVYGSDQDQYVKDEASATIMPANQVNAGTDENEGEAEGSGI